VDDSLDLCLKWQHVVKCAVVLEAFTVPKHLRIPQMFKGTLEQSERFSSSTNIIPNIVRPQLQFHCQKSEKFSQRMELYLQKMSTIPPSSSCGLKQRFSMVISLSFIQTTPMELHVSHQEFSRSKLADI